MPENLLFVLGAVICIVLIVAIVRWRQTTINPTETGTPSLQDGILDYETEIEIRQLLAQGQKIHAIQRVRDQTGLGLKEAKDYVEGRPIIAPLTNPPQSASRPSMGLGPEVETQIKALLQQGNKLEAIKLTRQHTGWGLKESKEYVEQWE